MNCSPPQNDGWVILLMGVSGCGKTSVGEALASRLGCPFYDGDDFHPPENKEKMSRGNPLDDEDRLPWLRELKKLIRTHLARNERAVVACSALKKGYRDLLRNGNPGLAFVYLRGEYRLILERMRQRKDHFMKTEMLRSQFDVLEEPGDEEALTPDILMDTDHIVESIIEQFSNRGIINVQSE